MQQFLKDYGPVLIFVLQIAWAFIGWWFSRNVATKQDVAALRSEIAGAVNRIEQLEVARENAPDAADISSLRLEMAHHTGQMREFNATLTGARETIEAQFAGIDTRIEGVGDLVKRAERMIDTVTQHLLSQTR